METQMKLIATGLPESNIQPGKLDYKGFTNVIHNMKIALEKEVVGFQVTSQNMVSFTIKTKDKNTEKNLEEIKKNGKVGRSGNSSSQAAWKITPYQEMVRGVIKGLFINEGECEKDHIAYLHNNENVFNVTKMGKTPCWLIVFYGKTFSLLCRYAM